VKLEFEVTDLMSKEEIEGHAKDIMIEVLRKKISEEAERLLTNAAYYCAYQIMDGVITESQKALIQAKTVTIIDKMSSSDVFRSETHWRDKPSIAYLEIEKAVRENKERITDKTISVIENFDYESRLQDDCLGILEGAIIKKIQAK